MQAIGTVNPARVAAVLILDCLIDRWSLALAAPHRAFEGAKGE